jgi:hypothetical protein
MNKVSKLPKGKTAAFAAGGRTKMFGTADRTRSKYPAEPQKKCDPASSMKRATWAARARRTRGDRPLERLERIPDLRTRLGEAAP